MTDGKSTDGSGCYFERERDLNGGVNSIITNDNFDGPTRIEVHRGEYLQVSGGCESRTKRDAGGAQRLRNLICPPVARWVSRWPAISRPSWPDGTDETCGSVIVM